MDFEIKMHFRSANEYQISAIFVHYVIQYTIHLDIYFRENFVESQTFLRKLGFEV